MTNTVLDKLTADRDAEIAAVDALLSREDADPTDPAITAGKDKIEALTRSIKARIEVETMKADGNSMLATIHKVTARQDADEAKTRTSTENLSMGETFVRSEVFSGYPGRGTSGRLTVNTRALPSGLADFSGVLPPAPQRDVTPPPAATTLLDLLPSIPVSQNSIETVVYSIKAGAAAVVAEKSGKPSIEFQAVPTPVTLSTIAVYTQLTRQLLEDGPAVRARIDGMLSREIRREAEEQAAGSLVAATLPTAQGTNLLAAIRNGVAVVQTAGYNPNAVLLNPADYADLDIDVFTSTLNGPAVGQRFWGLTPVPHAAQAAGTATVGDFSAGVERYVRTGVNLYITDSHADTFLSNVFTLLAECREATVVVRPSALVECTKTP